MSALLFYREITLLNRERHRGLRLKPTGDCRFAANTHFVPLAGQEFYQAARDYPILFIGEGEQTVPIALLGLEPERNEFLDEDGQWLANVYVPAFIRRYPFVLADTDAERFSVCFDAAYEGWNESEGEALFDDNGANTPYLDEVVDFLRGFTAEMRRTEAFVRTLQDLGLLRPRTLQLSHPGGERFTVNDFQAIDEEAFRALGDDDVLALHREGFLGWVFAHLMSLGAANRLFDRHIAGRDAAAPAGAASGSA